MNIGDTITVTYEESKKLRREGWKPRNDVVVMMYVGNADPAIRSNKSLAMQHARSTHKKQTDERWAQSYRVRMARA